MKIGSLAITITILTASLLSAADDKSWFDMPNCEMCKPLMQVPGLMDNMTWEQHNISTGLVSICRVKPEYVDSYKKAQKAMEATAARMMKGETVYICNMCKSFGKILAAGAKQDLVESENTFITVTTVSNPEAVKEIHTWGDRTNKEMQAMAQSEHSGHKN